MGEGYLVGLRTINSQGDFTYFLYGGVHDEPYYGPGAKEGVVSRVFISMGRWTRNFYVRTRKPPSGIPVAVFSPTDEGVGFNEGHSLDIVSCLNPRYGRLLVELKGKERQELEADYAIRISIDTHKQDEDVEGKLILEDHGGLEFIIKRADQAGFSDILEADKESRRLRRFKKEG